MADKDILIADDDIVVRNLLTVHLGRAGLACDAFETGDELLESMADEVLVAIVDLKMPGADGLTCLKAIKKKHPATEVILLTSVNEAAQAIEAMRLGAFDYLTKPFEIDEIVATVRKAKDLAAKGRSTKELRETVGYAGEAPSVLGESKAMDRIKALIPRIGQSENSVLLTGESGTGKGVVARALHAASKRAAEPFVVVSCPSLPRDLLESELFGHEKGSFSGAHQRRLGRLEMADKGTLFLDEIGELPLELQPKLLSCLQDRTYYRIGGNKLLQANFRLIAATNRDLPKMIAEGTFREDLYYRLNVLPAHLPPLRDREADALRLAQFFVIRASDREGSSCPQFTTNAKNLIHQYRWPGNVRELENAVERAFTLRLQDDQIDASDFPVQLNAGEGDVSSDSAESVSLAGKTLAQIEAQAIQDTLRETNGNKAAAARQLGITEKSIYNKAKRHGLSI